MAFSSEEFSRLAKEKNLSMAKIAKELGIARSTTASWARGKTKPDGCYMVKLEKILGLNPGEWGESALTLDLAKLTSDQRIQILEMYITFETENDGRDSYTYAAVDLPDEDKEEA